MGFRDLVVDVVAGLAAGTRCRKVDAAAGRADRLAVIVHEVEVGCG
jgi:hypothetical protein